MLEEKYRRNKRLAQILQAKDASVLYEKGLSYKVPKGISSDRFRGMIKAYLNGNHLFNWER